MEFGLRQTDYLAMAWRHKWLLLIGLAAGLGGGYLYYIKQPPVFLSMAKMQLVDPTVSLKQFEESQNNSSANPLSDEIMVMRSKVVLIHAAELGNLSSTSLFAGMHKEQIATWLANTQRLQIEPIGKDLKSSVYQISFEGPDPLLTQNVVQAILDSYSEHLKSKYRDFGQETLNLIAQAKGEVVERLEKQEADYDEFKRTTSLIFHDGRRVSVHRQNSDRLLAEKQDLLLKKARLDSKLQTLKEAYIANQPPEVILLTILSDAGETFRGLDRSPASTARNNPVLRDNFELSRAAATRELELVPLEAKLEEYQRLYGAEHPSVRDIQAQVNAVRKKIFEMEQNELLLADAREAAKKE